MRLAFQVHLTLIAGEPTNSSYGSRKRKAIQRAAVSAQPQQLFAEPWAPAIAEASAPVTCPESYSSTYSPHSEGAQRSFRFQPHACASRVPWRAG